MKSLDDPYIPEIDDARLAGSLAKVRLHMEDQQWRTLAEIADATGLRAEFVSSNLRDLRKEPNGSYVVDRRSRGPRANGLFEYRLLPPGTESPYSGARPKKIGKGFMAGMMYAARIVLRENDLTAAKLALREELFKASAKKVTTPKE